MVIHVTDLASPHPPVSFMPDHGLHNLERLAARAAALLGDCDCDLILGCEYEAMLVVMPRDGLAEAPTWVTTIVSGATFRLEALEDEARFDLLAEAPPHRILARLAVLAKQARDARQARSPAITNLWNWRA